MNWLAYLPLILIALFVIVFVVIRPKLSPERRGKMLAFAYGYLAHTFVVALVAWAVRGS